MTEPDNLDDAFAELAAELDPGRPDCECDCTSKSGPHSDRRCGRRATMLVAIHAWGCCNQADPVDPAAMDEDGNLCVVMCGPCARHAEQRAAANIRLLRSRLPSEVAMECPTCGRPTAHATDLVETRPI